MWITYAKSGVIVDRLMKKLRIKSDDDDDDVW